jgi:hypothetical protein
MTPLYVLAGQSNAKHLRDRGAVEAYLDTHNLEGEIISVATSATSIMADPQRLDWYPFEDGDNESGELLTELVETVSAKLSQGDYVLSGILWMQGERDAKANVAVNYGDHLEQLHDVLRDHFGNGFSFVISGLSEVLPRHRGNLESARINKGMAEVASGNARAKFLEPDLVFARHSISPSDSGVDGAHYSDAALDAIAAEFMRAMTSGSGAVAETVSYRIDEVDSFDWITTSTGRNASGQKVWRHTVYDDGVSQTIEYENGSKARMVKHDIGHAHDWSVIEATWQDGLRTVVRTMDEG